MMMRRRCCSAAGVPQEALPYFVCKRFPSPSKMRIALIIGTIGSSILTLDERSTAAAALESGGRVGGGNLARPRRAVHGACEEAQGR